LCRMALGLVWRHGAQCLRFDGRPGESRPWHASWWLLCSSRGGFEGGHAGVLAWLSSVRQFEGLADGGILSCTMAGVAMSRQLGFPQCWGWPCSARYSGTTTGMAAQGRR
jgi:hypothetical protein